MPPPLAPNEHLSGTAEQRHALLARLASIRSQPAPHHSHPHLTLMTLADLTASPPQWIDPAVLDAGIAITRLRYRALGLTRLLPPERAWIGTASADPDAFGGLHYPGQGYRHWQMTAVITRYGLLADPELADPGLAALDLIRAYAHDSLHYGSYRRYQWHPDGTTPVRVRYGINFRGPDGTPYSRTDTPGTRSTRNLGIIIEAATDREARAITRHTARLAAITPPPLGPDRAEYRDTTGRLAPADRTRHHGSAPVGATGFLTRMTDYQQAVGTRYAELLTELAPDAPGRLHAGILRAIINGSLADLSHHLNQRHGPATFTRLFRDDAYPPGRRAA
jgi:hypothetical protein